VTVLALSFGAALLTGIPVALALGVAGTLYLLVRTDIPLVVVPQRLFVGTDVFILMALPLFIMAGSLMTTGRLTARLVDFARALVGHLRGGLAQVNTVHSMIFGGISGAAVADIAAEGPVILPMMRDDGYDMEYAAALTAATACVGPVIPPSIPMVIYGLVSGTSIGALFLAGVIPGVLIGLVIMVYNHLVVLRHHRPPAHRRDARFSFSELARSSRSALVVLLLPVIIVGGIVGGVFTPTEAAGVAAAYALVVGLFVLRTLRLRDLRAVFLDTAVLTSAVMLVVAMASLFSWIIAAERVPAALADLFERVSGNPQVFLALVIVLLLLFGTFLEPTSAIIILTPVLLPVAVKLGIDPIHFGVVTVIGMVVGLITPPVGLCLFVVGGLTGLSLERVSRAALPFVGLLTGILILVAYVPLLTLWLPRLLLGP
jgi:C4-dicarboxylate transporter DctM subunit